MGDRMSGVFKLLLIAVTKQISSAYLAIIGFYLNKTRFSARLASCAATNACISQAYYFVNCWKGVTVMQNKTDLNKCKTPLRFGQFPMQTCEILKPWIPHSVSQVGDSPADDWPKDINVWTCVRPPQKTGNASTWCSPPTQSHSEYTRQIVFVTSPFTALSKASKHDLFFSPVIV